MKNKGWDKSTGDDLLFAFVRGFCEQIEIDARKVLTILNSRDGKCPECGQEKSKEKE